MRIAMMLMIAAGALCAQTVWTFERTDRVGGHAVTVEGAPKVIDTPLGKAVWFDGAKDALFIPDHPLAGAKEFTIEAIFRPDGGQFEQRWLHLQEDGSDKRMLFEIRVREGEWYLDSFVNAGASKALIDAGKRHPIGQWYHAAMVYDGREFRHYVNGTLQGAAVIAFEPQGKGRASVGVRINRVSYFHGAVREARFSRKALRPEEFRGVPAK